MKKRMIPILCGLLTLCLLLAAAAKPSPPPMIPLPGKSTR